MKRQDVLKLKEGLTAVGSLKGKSENRVKFVYAVAKNQSKVDSEIDALKAAIEPTEKFKEFEEKRIKINEKYCRRDENDKPIEEKSKDGVPVYTFDDAEKKKRDKDVESLFEESKSVLDERQEQVDKYNEMLKEDIDLELHKVKIDFVPDDITAAQMGLIQDMIDEE